MEILGIPIAIFLIGYYFGKKSKPASEQSSRTSRVSDILYGELQRTKNTAVKIALAKVQYRINGLSETEAAKNAKLYIAQLEGTEDAPSTPQVQEAAQTQATTSLEPEQAPTPQQSSTAPQLDSTSLLLYFGAFLFITSVGLFVAFGELTGELRTFLVLLVALGIYALGMYLYTNTKKLLQVGEAFAGIGMFMIPLVGVAAYTYIFDETNGAAIWAVTSLSALWIYFFTVMKLRTAFVSYMLIGSIVSTLLATVGIIEGPLYAFIWMLIIAGLVVQSVGLLLHSNETLREASQNSTQLLTPLAIGLSFATFSTSGTYQLAVTLALSSAYYLLQSFLPHATSTRTDTLRTAAHLLAILAIATGAYSIDSSGTDAGLALAVVTVGHILLIASSQLSSKILSDNMRTTATIVAAATPLLLMQDGTSLHIGMAVAFTYGITHTVVNKDSYGFAISLAVWLFASLTIGQYLIQPKLPLFEQMLATNASILLLVLGVAMVRKKLDTQQRELALFTIVAGLLLSATLVLATRNYNILVMSLLWYGAFQLVQRLNQMIIWHYLANISIFIPFVFTTLFRAGLDASYLHSAATAVALIFSIISALQYRATWPRWMSVAAWLVLPVAVALDNVAGLSISPVYIMVSYALVTLALCASRLIAMGRIFNNAKLPLQSMMRSKSIAYAGGVYTALAVSSLFALFAQESILLQALMVAINGMILVGFGVWVERNAHFYAAIPCIIQLVLLRGLVSLDGGLQSDHQLLLPLASTGAALLTLSVYNFNKFTTSYKQSALLVLFGTTLTSIYFTNGELQWPIPYGFVVSTLALLAVYWRSTLLDKEKIGYLIMLGLFGVLSYHGIDSLLVYTHIFTLLLGFYWYLHHRIKDVATAENYLNATLLMLTAPMVFAALDEPSTYGTLLLFEQVGVFLIGLKLKRSLVARWGLYTAVATVIFQLRGLGWAMLAVLSLFIISLGIYEALKRTND